MNKKTLKTIGVYLLFLILFTIALLGKGGYFENRVINNAVMIDGVMHIMEVKDGT